MKCVMFVADLPESSIFTGDVFRVDDESARNLVKSGCAEYTSRSRWRNFWIGNRAQGYIRRHQINSIIKAEIIDRIDFSHKSKNEPWVKYQSQKLAEQ